MAPDYRTVPDYRHLQLICERQAVVTSNKEARRALEDMAEKYRKMAEALERKLREQQGHYGRLSWRPRCHYSQSSSRSRSALDVLHCRDWPSALVSSDRDDGPADQLLFGSMQFAEDVHGSLVAGARSAHWNLLANIQKRS